MLGWLFPKRARRDEPGAAPRREQADEINRLHVGTDRLDGFNRISVLQAQHGTREEAAKAARLWRPVFQKYPEVILDLVRIGGLFQQRELYFEDGIKRSVPLDPTELAYEQGRREAVLDILGHNLSIDELNQLMEASDAF